MNTEYLMDIEQLIGRKLDQAEADSLSRLYTLADESELSFED